MSARRTLDKSKPHGTVWGDNVRWRFEQDGRKFDHEGVEILPSELAGDTAPDPAPAPTVESATSNLPGASNTTAALALIGAASTLLAKDAESLIEELEDESDDMLQVLETLESTGKKRKTVLAAIEALQQKRSEPPPSEGAGAPASAPVAPPDATGAAGASDQVSAQLGA
jgi:hypothetical protein